MVVESHCLKRCRPFYDHSRLQHGWMTAVYLILIGGYVIRTIRVHLQISLTMSPWIIEYIKNTTRLSNASFPFKKTYKALCKSTDVQKTLQHRQEEITKCVSCAESSGLNSLHAWCYMGICPTFLLLLKKTQHIVGVEGDEHPHTSKLNCTCEFMHWETASLWRGGFEYTCKNYLRFFFFLNKLFFYFNWSMNYV